MKKVYNVPAPSSTAFQYGNIFANSDKRDGIKFHTVAEDVADWFLNLAPMPHKKLQKLCYYAYCWFIVFFNDAEGFTKEDENNIDVLFPNKFQAWIHGPVLPELYQKYKQYGWVDIPKGSCNPSLSEDVCDLLNQVWESYGHFSADELEFLSHREDPWRNARKGIPNGAPCVNEISPYEILVYYSGLE